MTVEQLLLLSVLILVIVAVLNISLTVTSLRRLIRAIDRFADSGGKEPMQLPWAAPGLVRSLTSAFARLVGKVSVAVKREEELTRLKSEFISTAAHQLQTPMAAIRWGVEGLKATQITPDQQPLLAAMEEKSSDLENIIQTFIRVSEIESEIHAYKMEAVDISSVLAEVAEERAQVAGVAQVALEAEAEPNLPAVSADRGHIKQVLITLVENGIRYTPAGGSVKMSASLGPRLVVVSVRDSGIGVLESDLGKIFEPFYRGRNAATQNTQGNGLELYIARTIVRAHGGELAFTNNTPAAGTTFTFTLPIAL